VTGLSRDGGVWRSDGERNVTTILRIEKCKDKKIE
jgi:hypothetical protein